MSEHLTFKELLPNPKTKRFHVISNFDKSILGTIEWCGSWRQYCFFPEAETVWSWECSIELGSFLKMRNDEQRKKKG